MQNAIEDISRGIFEIRNMLGPIDLKLDKLDRQVFENRASVETMFSQFQAQIVAHTSQISEQTSKFQEQSRQIAILFERVRWIEVYLKVPKSPEDKVVDGVDSTPSDIKDPRV